MSLPFVDLKTQYESLKEEIDLRIHNVLDHGQFIMGPEVVECEQALKKLIQCEYALTCSSGTDAALMALMALDIGSGDEVITTAFSFIATIETIVLAGATPVLIDIDPLTYNLDIHQLELALSPRTKAIMPVSLYGQPADLDEINSFAQTHKLYVIEDAAQSFAAPYKNKRSGHLSDMGITSFFPAKPLGCYGDGGAIFTDHPEWAQKLSQLRNHGQSSRYHHPLIGINGRLDTLQCAILLPKMKRYLWEIDKRNELAQKYNTAFHSLQALGISIPHVREDRQSVWAQYTLRVPHRESFQKIMFEKYSVPTAVHYPSTMVDQPAYKNKIRVVGTLPEAQKAAQEVVSLPIYPDMSENIQEQIITAVQSSLKNL